MNQTEYNHYDTPSINGINRIENVPFRGGILGILGDSPQNLLNRRISKLNNQGYKVVQIIPAASGNLFLTFFRVLLLIITLFMYTTTNGYYLVVEKKTE